MTTEPAPARSGLPKYNASGTSPDYTAPPLVEVALSVEFLPVEGLGAIELANLAHRWTKDYPHVQELPPLPMSPPIGLGIQMSGGMLINIGAPQLRLWLTAGTGNTLVQIQRDRLILNWRADKTLDPYPRYVATLRPEFHRLYEDFSSFLSDRGHATAQLVAVEAAYVNKIPNAAGQRADLSGTIRSQSAVSLTAGAPAMTRLNQVWQEQNSDGQVSMLTLSIDTAGNGEDATIMTLSGRSSASGDGSSAGVARLLDACHDRVVVTFDELVTEDRRAEWGRKS